MMNISEADTHIRLLHNLAAGIDGVMVLASYGETIKPSVKHFRVGDVDGMTQAAIEMAQRSGANIYMPLSVMRPDLPATAKGKEKDIVAVLGFVADFDKGMGVNYEARCPIKPSYVLETSPNNAQCFFLLDKPLLIASDSDRAKAKELAIRLTQACDGTDPIGADLSHVWRVPATLNWPNAKKIQDGRDPNPFTVGILKPFEGALVSPTGIQSLSPVVNNKTKANKNDIKLEYRKKIDLQELANNGKTDLVSKIENRTPKGQRSEVAGSIVFTLLNLGYGTGDIAEVISAHPKGIGERYRDKGSIDAEVLRLAAKKNDQSQAEIDEPKPYTLQALEAFDESTIPPRSWVLGNVILRGYLTVLIAPPGVGKSTATLMWATSVATNRDLCGLPIRESGAVGIINNEDDIPEMKRRIAAIKRFYKISQAELAGRFFLQSGAVSPLCIAKKNDKKTLYPYHKDALIDFVRSNNIKVLFVDPFLETHEADENDNRQISEVARMFREVAQKADCAIVLVHHTRKQSGTSSEGHAGNMDSGRGASSLIGAARVVCTLYDMSEADARKYGIADDERHLYLKLDDAKANLSLKSDQSLWYRRESVMLANGDSVGVLSVAKDLQKSVSENRATLTGTLLSAIITQDVFSILREKGKMKREDFIKAMVKACIYLGAKTTNRAALQSRTEKYLMGKGVSHGGIRVFMKKISTRFFVYYEPEENFASLPEDTQKHPAKKTESHFHNVSPEMAGILRQIPHNASENLIAGSPPL